MSTRYTNVKPCPELQDGQTYYGLTQTYYGLTLNDGTYASKRQTRSAVLAWLRRYSFVSGLGTTEQRVRVCNEVLSDDAFLRSVSGQVITSVGRDVVDAVIAGRWSAQ